MIDKPIRVLIIDDSAFARKVIREVLETDSSIEVVGYARDGLDGLEKIADLKPDIVTLDLIMPDLDGIGLLKAIPKENPPKFIVVSASGSESDLALEALELGAIDIITKPTASPSDKLYEMSEELLRTIKGAMDAVSIPYFGELRKNTFVKSPEIATSGKIKLVVIGTSTGGPQAITELFKTFPENFPIPVVIALHIPAGYTTSLAERVSRSGNLNLIEAYNGIELVAHQAYIAPGGMHLKIKNEGGKIFANVTKEPYESLYHPSVNILFETAATELNGAVLGVVLTGMGNDGTNGAKAIKDAGGVIIAESASSCVVYGMPRSIIENGLSNVEAPLKKIVSTILSQI